MREKTLGSITTKKDVAFWKNLGATTEDLRKVNQDVVGYRRILQGVTHPLQKKLADNFALKRKLLLFQELDLRDN